MKMFKIDLSKKNAAISIIFTLDVTFFCVAILLSLGIRPTTQALGDKVWAVFMGTQMALMAVLNATAKEEIGISPDSPDAKVKQTSTVKQETTVSVDKKEGE